MSELDRLAECRQLAAQRRAPLNGLLSLKICLASAARSGLAAACARWWRPIASERCTNDLEAQLHAGDEGLPVGPSSFSLFAALTVAVVKPQRS